MMEDLRFQRAIHRAIRTPRRPENNSPHLPSIHLSHFFSLCLLQDTPSFSRMDDGPYALFVTRRQCKNPRSSRIFFPDGISSSKLDLWTYTSPPSDHKAPEMSRLNSNGRDSTWQTTMIESINAFVLSDLYRKCSLYSRNKNKFKDK